MWFPFAGLVLGIIAIIQIKKTKERGLWLAILSIILPIVTFVLMVSGIIMAVVFVTNKNNESAAKLGITSSEFNNLKKAIDGNCNIEALQVGDYYQDSNYTQSYTINSVKDGYAVGKRTCSSVNKEEYFVASKDNKYDDNSTWRFTLVSQDQPTCSALESYGLPKGSTEDCQDSYDSRQPVRAL